MPSIHPSTLIIFGATGDLFSKKLVPALRRLFDEGRLPTCCNVIGVGRRALTQGEFLQIVRTALGAQGHMTESDEKFFSLFSYMQGDFIDMQSFVHLRSMLESIDQGCGVSTSRIFYLAVPPDLFPPLLENIARSGLMNDSRGFRDATPRILLEKPFGSDEASARVLNARLRDLFLEDQIYRIDHYFGKPTVRALPQVRVEFPLLNQRLTGKQITRIDIRLLETNGAEGRGAFYDSVGALRDVGQNHMIGLLTLLGMDISAIETVAEFREARTCFCESMSVPTHAEVLMGIRGQYEGYTNIVGVRKNSATETYFKLSSMLRSGSLEGVRVSFESGKRLRATKKDMRITFTRGDSLLIELEPRIRIEHLGEGGIPITTYFEKPYEEKKRYTAEYAELFHDALRGDQRWFMTGREVEAAWRFVDPFIVAWKNNDVPLEIYAPASEAA